jgi:hypothetical protein
MEKLEHFSSGKRKEKRNVYSTAAEHSRGQSEERGEKSSLPFSLFLRTLRGLNCTLHRRDHSF